MSPMAVGPRKPQPVHVWPVSTVCCWCGWVCAKISKREQGVFCRDQDLQRSFVYCKDQDHSQQSGVYLLENVAVTLKGPGGTCRGTSITTMYNTFILLGKNKKRLWVDKWWRNRKELAAVRTACSHTRNMVKGDALGFWHKIRSMCTHSPIGVVIQEDGSLGEIRNFLGKKHILGVFLFNISGPEK